MSVGNGADPSAPIPLPPAVNLTDQWRRYLDQQRQQTAVVVALTLPSGMTVRATRPTLLDLMAAGRIPDALAGPVEELIALATVAGDGGVAQALNQRSQANPVEFAAQFLAILNAVWLAAVVEPRFGDAAADPDVIPVGSVSVDDRTFLFVWAQGVEQSVATFLDRKSGAGPVVGTAPDREDVRAGPGDAGRSRSEA